jgi:20S proteasome alpha/beta subunit
MSHVPLSYVVSMLVVASCQKEYHLIPNGLKMIMNMSYSLFCFTATNGVVLATEKKQKSILYDDTSIHKIELITKNVGMVYSGMGPDYR